MTNFIQNVIIRQWYQKLTWLRVLLPISLLYLLIIKLKKILSFTYVKKASKPPVWIVGNIVAGGTGKTPFVKWLVEIAQIMKLKPIVIGHGYKSHLNTKVKVCHINDDSSIVGDETLMLKQMINAPVIVAKKRKDAVEFIKKHYPKCDLIICDDGLQDYSVKRDIEIIIHDENTMGNKKYIPVRPLREPISRLKEVDFTVDSCKDVTVSIDALKNLATNKIVNPKSFNNKTGFAVAGISNPDKFFNLLQLNNFKTNNKSFIDHNNFNEEDFKNQNDNNIFMTSKDAVKCKKFATSNFWEVIIKYEVSEKITHKIKQLLLEIKS